MSGTRLLENELWIHSDRALVVRVWIFNAAILDFRAREMNHSHTLHRGDGNLGCACTPCMLATRWAGWLTKVGSSFR